MQRTSNLRLFSSINKSIVILANSKSADIVGGRIMNKLQQVSNVNDFDYFGYGDVHMMNAGLKVSEFDLSNFKEKQFYTFRKTKTFEES
jgi:lipid A disaccharide synthetase